MFEKAFQTFEDLIRRSVAPSVTFFLVALVMDLFGAWATGSRVDGGAGGRIREYGQFIKDIGNLQSTGAIITIVVLVIIGMSYVLATAQQILFDNRLRKNFEPIPKNWFKNRDPIKPLRELRARVVNRLDKVDDVSRVEREPKPERSPTDYILYEILGGIDPTDTHRFVDDAKAMGIFFASVMLVLAGNAVFNTELRAWRIVFMALVPLCYWLGFNVIAAQYRARALRLYVNFLGMPLKRIQFLLFKEKKANSSNEKKDS